MINLFLDLSWLRKWLSIYSLWIVISFLSLFLYTILRMITASNDIVDIYQHSIQYLHVNNNKIPFAHVVGWFTNLIKSHFNNSLEGGSLYLGK